MITKLVLGEVGSNLGSYNLLFIRKRAYFYKPILPFQCSINLNSISTASGVNHQFLMLLTYYIVKNLTFPRKEVWPFVLGSWDVIFVCLDASGEPDSNSVMWFRVGALGHVVSVDLETEFAPVGNQSVISHEDKVEPWLKLWTVRLEWASLVGSTLCVLWYTTHLDSIRERTVKAPCLALFLDSVLCASSLTWF